MTSLRATPLILAVLVAALPLAGCIENMRDLKDRLGGGDDEVPPTPVTPLAVDEPPRPNATPLKAPVARIEVYAAGGALAFKSSFKGDNATEPVAGAPKEKLTVSASESEALEANATLASFTWLFRGQTLTGRQAAVELPEEPGAWPLVLTVVDSNGMSDAQSVTLAVMPVPFDVVIDLQTGLLAGAEVEGEQHGDPSSVKFPVETEIDGKPVQALAAEVVVSPDLACDVILEVLAPDGASLGRVDDNGVTTATQDETLAFGALPAGEYEAKVSPFHCADHDGVPVKVTITYVEVVEGLGHGGHAH